MRNKYRYLRRNKHRRYIKFTWNTLRVFAAGEGNKPYAKSGEIFSFVMKKFIYFNRIIAAKNKYMHKGKHYKSLLLTPLVSLIK